MNNFELSSYEDIYSEIKEIAYPLRNHLYFP